jgi:hypothetical protein
VACILPHPTPPHPLRKQDAIVCGKECWEELQNAGGTAPTKEASGGVKRFLLNTHNTHPHQHNTHSFPLITPAGAERNPVEQRKRKTPPGAASTRGRKKHRSKTLGGKRLRPPDNAVKKRPKKKAQLSAHINPWTINSGKLRLQSAGAAESN